VAHDIDCSTGKPALAYIGETPWHGLGERLSEGQSIEVWIKAARLDWELKRLPVQYFIDAKLRVMDDRFVLSRSDTGAALSVVSDDYHIVQPKEVLEFYRDLVASFHYTLETAGALNGGRKVWALAKTGKTTIVPTPKGRQAWGVCFTCDIVRQDPRHDDCLYQHSCRLPEHIIFRHR
jgi:phage/plasmid-like protein (TIGR03299 family)